MCSVGHGLKFGELSTKSERKEKGTIQEITKVRMSELNQKRKGREKIKVEMNDEKRKKYCMKGRNDEERNKEEDYIRETI